MGENAAQVLMWRGLGGDRRWDEPRNRQLNAEVAETNLNSPETARPHVRDTGISACLFVFLTIPADQSWVGRKTLLVDYLQLSASSIKANKRVEISWIMRVRYSHRRFSL